MENIILCPECQGMGQLLRTKKKRKKKSSEIGRFAYPRRLSPLSYLKEDLEQPKENKKIEYVICFRCGGLGTISI